VQVSKRLIGMASAASPSTGLATEARLFADGFGSAEQREGMSAFLEKRKPAFATE
jgi:enoyl-CoA hydratase/carnithine racemase